MIIPMPNITMDMFALNRRETVCLTIAFVAHCMLFLWKGIPMELLDKDKNKLGETLVQVQFSTDASSYGRGAAPARRKSFASKVRSFFKKSAPAKKQQTVARSQNNQEIKVKKNFWEKAKSTLKNKAFSKKESFAGMTKKDDMTLAKGKTQDLAFSKMNKDSKSEAPNLKNKDYRLSKKDSPFKISKKRNNDALSMNAVPINVGKSTSKSLKSLPNMGSSPSLKSKAFSKGSLSGKGFGASGKGSKGGLAKGSASKIRPGSGMLASINKSHSGGGLPAMGSSSGKTGYAGGSLSRARSAFKSSSGKQGVSRSSAKASSNAGFSISGALSNRQILRKFFPKPKSDTRVALKFRVDWAGRVLDGIVIVISSGLPSFDREVMAALKKWVFSRLSASRSNEIQEGVITFLFKGI